MADNIYSFGSRESMNRVFDSARLLESGGGDDFFEDNPTVDGILYAKVTQVVSASETESKQIEVQAIQQYASIDELGEITYEVAETDPITWKTEDPQVVPNLRNLRLMPGQSAPAFGDIISPFYQNYTMEKVAEGEEAKDLPEGDWFFHVYKSAGQSFFQAVVTGFYNDGFVADVYALNQTVIEDDPDADPPVIGTTPLATNQEVPFGVPGAPTYLQEQQSIVVMQLGLTFIPLGHVTI